MSSNLNAIVIPCLNEEVQLAETCQSLGFGKGIVPPNDTLIIIVDNGSVDATLNVAKGIQETSPAGTVIIANETVRGFVPPRRRGNALAMSIALERNISKRNLLIVQADSDTTYSEGYVDAMSASARKEGHGVLIDARCEYKADFAKSHQAFIAMCNEADTAIEPICFDRDDDMIVDDKACSYWASDYDQWGGHQREFTTKGEEIHSETTRLYLRGKSYGACRKLCDDAIAQHSARRVIEDPAYDFATCGFPRESSFKDKWNQFYNGPKDIQTFCKILNHPSVAIAVRCRRAHLVGLFHDLTVHVRMSMQQDAGSLYCNEIGMTGIPQRDVEAVRRSPGLLLEDVLRHVDNAWISS